MAVWADPRLTQRGRKPLRKSRTVQFNAGAIVTLIVWVIMQLLPRFGIELPPDVQDALQKVLLFVVALLFGGGQIAMRRAIEETGVRVPPQRGGDGGR